MNKDQDVKDLLKLLGIHMSIGGFKLLKFAILDGDYQCMCKSLFLRAGEQFNMKRSNVERCMRHAIESTYRLNKKAWADVLGFNVQPTLKEFIVVCNDYIFNN